MTVAPMLFAGFKLSIVIEKKASIAYPVKVCQISVSLLLVLGTQDGFLSNKVPACHSIDKSAALVLRTKRALMSSQGQGAMVLSLPF